MKDYSVAEGENCKKNYKKCGILNNKGRILCLPEEEECPLNGFAISENIDDSKYIGYSRATVKDSDLNKDYYFYYTNSNINGNIITNFKLSNGYPCAMSYEKSWITIFSNEANKNPICKTTVEGKLRNENYIKIEGSDISLKSLYKDNEISYTGSETDLDKIIVNLYARNYDKDEECNYQYFSDIEKADDSFKIIQLVIRIINIISVIFIFALMIYCLFICKYITLEFYGTFFIVHIFGITENIVSICLTYQNKFYYKCGADTEFNNKIDNIYEENKSFNRDLVLAMCILSIISLSLNLLFSICLKKNNKNIGIQTYNNSYPQNYEVPNGVVQPIIIQQIPYNGPGFASYNPAYNGNYNIPYNNVPIINNEINSQSNRYAYSKPINNNNSAAAPSS